MQRGYSYVRFSSLKQAKGDSLRRQTEATVRYCKKHGLFLDETLQLTDLGMSAHYGQNSAEGALAGFLEAVRLGKVPKDSVLIVESLDRLSREKVGKALSQFIGILNADVRIVTLTPEREYTSTSINDIASLLEPIIVMQRAWEESALKASRGKAAWERKREISGVKKLTGRIPAWLILSEDKTTFHEIPTKVEVVKRIYRMTCDGFGLNSIVKILNGEKVPGLGRVDYHQRSYVAKILKTKAVIGEYQPHALVLTDAKNKDGRPVQRKVRKPCSEVISGYYPAIVSESDYYKAQQALSSRRTKPGRIGKDVRNLFSGLLYENEVQVDADDRLVKDEFGNPVVKRATVQLVNKGKRSKGPKLVSSAAMRGQAKYKSFDYGLVEKAFLGLCVELKPTMFQGLEEPGNLPDDADALATELIKIDHKIGVMQKSIMESETIESMIKVLRDLEVRKKEIKEALDEIKTSRPIDRGEAIGEVKTLIELLKECSDDDRFELRTRMRGKIRQLVRGIELSHLHNGGFAMYIDFIEIYVRSIFVMPDGTFNMLDDRCPALFSGSFPE